MWLARDKDGELWLYEFKPYRGIELFIDPLNDYSKYNETVLKLSESWFPEVTWDNSPVEIEIKLKL